MRFSLGVFSGLLEGDRTAPLSRIARAAYHNHLEPHHQFWLRNTFKAGLSAMPSRNEFLGRLCPFVKDREARDALCYADLEAFVELVSKALSAVTEMLNSLDLDDTRKA